MRDVNSTMYMFLPNDEIKGTVKLEVRHDKLSDKKRYEAYGLQLGLAGFAEILYFNESGSEQNVQNEAITPLFI